MQHLLSQYDSGNPEALPWINSVPLGVTRNQSGGYPAGALYIEAYWCSNYYMRTEDPLRQCNTWIADLLPYCPLYKVIHDAWKSTIAFFFTEKYRRQLEDANETMISAFRDNLHWSIHSTNGNAILTPVDLGQDFPRGEQLAHVSWVYDYAMEIEPALRTRRFDAAFRHVPEQAVMEPGEFSCPLCPYTRHRGRRMARLEQGKW